MLKQLSFNDKELLKPKVKVVIQQDDYSINPRDDYNLGVMICKHRNYNLGVYPDQPFDFYESWLDRSIAFYLKSERRIKNINIDEIIEDKPSYGYPRPGKHLRDISRMEIFVHIKE